jgi:hypothetical protein
MRSVPRLYKEGDEQNASCKLLLACLDSSLLETATKQRNFEETDLPQETLHAPNLVAHTRNSICDMRRRYYPSDYTYHIHNHRWMVLVRPVGHRKDKEKNE